MYNGPALKRACSAGHLCRNHWTFSICTCSGAGVGARLMVGLIAARFAGTPHAHLIPGKQIWRKSMGRHLTWALFLGGGHVNAPGINARQILLCNSINGGSEGRTY